MILEHQLKCKCAYHQFNHFESSSGPSFFLEESRPHYPTDRIVDYEHLKLEIQVDLAGKRLSGTCTHTFTVLAPECRKLSLHAVDLKVEKVLLLSSTETALDFNQTPTHLHIGFKHALKAGDRGEIRIVYSVVEPRAGLYFIHPTEHQPHRPWQLWTQGQDQDNRYWIPCHDDPNEKASTEMIVTVDEKYLAISNGRLIGTSSDAQAGTRTFHWKQSMPHASYLVTLCVGEYVEIKESWKNKKGEEIPVLYYTMPGREEETQVSFRKTPKMLDFFSQKIGVDYPYEKYAQTVAWDFIYGGMENTSATTQTEYTLHPETVDQDYSSEPLVAHELAHQWFGDLLTCKEWAHGWLNEGFATYFEGLWMEHEHGKEEFLYEIYLNELAYKAEDGGSYRRPIVTNVYISPSNLFDRHLYEKGARVLHMLRCLVGDDLWWKCINQYVLQNYGKTVETVELQRVFEENSGLSLSWFFDQWVYRGGHPSIMAKTEWDQDKKQLKVHLTQKQAEQEKGFLYRLPLQIKIGLNSTEKVESVLFTEKERTFWLDCPVKPEFVSINPENTILGKWDYNAGREYFINQLKKDTDVMGRLFAAKELAKDHSLEVILALQEQLNEEKFWGVQSEILNSLAKIGSEKAIHVVMEAYPRIKHPRARKNVARALRNPYATEKVTVFLQKLLKEDQSPLVQYEAGVSLGICLKLKPKGLSFMQEQLGKQKSWHDYYDRGLIRGIASFNYNMEALEILQQHAHPRHSMFLRAEAVEALSEFSLGRIDFVVPTLLALVDDANYFVRLQAIHALERLGDTQAVPALRRVLQTAVEPRLYRAALVATKTLLSGKTPGEEAQKLREEIRLLKEDYQNLLSRFEKMEAKSEDKKDKS